jgi:hypothetical protein
VTYVLLRRSGVVVVVVVVAAADGLDEHVRRGDEEVQLVSREHGV